MTGVLALAQGLGPESFATYWPYAFAFLGGILTLALGLIAVRRFLAAPPSHGYVLDINAVRAHGAAAQQRQPEAHKQAA